MFQREARLRINRAAGRELVANGMTGRQVREAVNRFFGRVVFFPAMIGSDALAALESLR